jgi:hypothetical protein
MVNVVSFARIDVHIHRLRLALPRLILRLNTLP